MTTTEPSPTSARAFLWTILFMLAAVLILLMLPLALPAHAQGVAPDAEPVPVTSADVLGAPEADPHAPTMGLEEWLVVVVGLLVALGKALQVIVAQAKEMRALISGVETGGDRATKAAIAVKAELAGVGKRLAKRVERETTRRPKPAPEPDTGG